MSPHKPWQQKTVITGDEVRQILQVNLPELAVHTVSALGDGWDNTTWLVDEKWVFRLPKHAEAGQLLLSEIKILPNLPKLGVHYPKPKFICLAPQGFAYPFYGHSYLPGISADRADLTLDNRIALAENLGLFLKKLHAFPIEKAKMLGIDYDQIERVNIKKRFVVAKERLEYLTQHGLVKNHALFIETFEHYLDLRVPKKIVLGHGDFYARHLLLDDNKRLAAVIDWGDCELLSPAVDLAIVYQFIPSQAHQQFWDAYGKVDEITRCIAKLRSIYSATTIAWYTHQVQALLTEGLLGLEFIREAIEAEE